MSNKNTSLKSGIRDNLLRETVHDFLEQEIKKGSALSIVSAYFTIYAYEKMQPLPQQNRKNSVFSLVTLILSNVWIRTIQIQKRLI